MWALIKLLDMLSIGTMYMDILIGADILVVLSGIILMVLILQNGELFNTERTTS